VTATTDSAPDVVPAAAGGGGLGYMVQSALWFAVMGLFVKLASATLPTLQIVCVRGALTLAIATVVLRAAGLSPFGPQWRLLLTRGLVGSVAMICFYAAVVHLPLAEATVIHQTAPLFTALFAAWFLHERLSPRVLGSLLAAFLGVVAIARPAWLLGHAAPATATTDGSWRFAFVALLGAILSAVAYVTVRRLGRTESPLVVVFWLPLMTLPVSAPFAVAVWVWPDARTWCWLAGIAVSTQLAQVALTKGLAREAAGRATAVGYLQVAFATVFGAVFFAAWPDPWSWAGMALIVGSVWLGARR
jgi:drug/metabolite transporter (DMT)-like permease